MGPERKQVQNLLQHLTVLPGGNNAEAQVIGCGHFLNDGNHFYGFRPGSNNNGYMRKMRHIYSFVITTIKHFNNVGYKSDDAQVHT